MRSIVSATLPFLLLLSACVAEDPDQLAVDPADQAAPADDKADRATLAFRVVEDDVGDRAADEARVVLASRSAYQGYFGHAAPADVDFSREWIFFYSAGTQPTGGYAAAVDEIARSRSGKTLYFTTHLTAPGAGCAVTEALTAPHVLVAFHRPSPRPTALVAYQVDDAVACDRCAGLSGDACTADAGCELAPEGCDPAPIDPDTGLPHPCDPILVCRARQTTAEGGACGSRGQLPCAEGLYCSFPEAASCGEWDASGTCTVVPQMCDATYAPVCGCDGVTYANACTAGAAAVSARHDGACAP